MDDISNSAPKSGVPQFFQWISTHHPPHSLVYSDRHETFYASHPTIGTITQSHLPTSRARFLIPRGILRDPSSLCYMSAVPTPHSDADNDERDDLYFADSKGCRLWCISLAEGLSARTPQLLYQSYRSPFPALHLQSLADYQRDDASTVARVAREDKRMHVRGVAVARARHRLFWCQGQCVMCCALEGDGEPADARSDLLIVADGEEFENVQQIWVDAEERWLCLRNEGTGEERRVSLGEIGLQDEPAGGAGAEQVTGDIASHGSTNDSSVQEISSASSGVVAVAVT